ncbi:MAG: hypothetical protein A2X18_11900 [Bacteroidetes bacterium GWF2_40_14]|nr:MAG: hypothetical protein A2X18_11900 [Bacteroidetes bacterium GWF2_40_14]
MKAFAYFSLIFLLALSSCSTLKNSVGSVPHVIDSIPETQIFELQMNFRDDEFGGLLLLKKYGNDHYRFILTSHFGLTVFDMEINKREYVTHYCIQPLNNKRALYLLRNDFSMLIKPDFFPNIRYKIDSSSRLTSLVRAGSITKTVMYFTDYKDSWPSVLSIGHPHLKLYIKLTTLPDASATPI